MAPTRVKICGLTRFEDAELAVELGAWALGMIFYPASPRRCSLEQAGRIAAALRRRAELCGVFVNASLEEIAHTAEELGLTMVQLHGDEGPSFCAEVSRRTGARVVKAVQIADAGDVRVMERFHVDFHLADARSSKPARESLRGGTGETFDWTLLAGRSPGGRRAKAPLILSGGLTPENVGEAIELVHPYAVDTASGTEHAPGRKDHAKLRAFFAAVERAGGGTGANAEGTGVAAEGTGVAAEGKGVAAEGKGVAAEGKGVAAEGKGVAAEGTGVAAEGTGVAAEGKGATADGEAAPVVSSA